MTLVKRFAMFWVDFIVGDAWEVALGIGLALALVGLAAHTWDITTALGFVLPAVVVAVTALALLRATRASRR